MKNVLFMYTIFACVAYLLGGDSNEHFILGYSDPSKKFNKQKSINIF